MALNSINSELLTNPAKTACFSGHRPEGIPFDIVHSELNRRILSSSIYLEIYEAYQKGYRTFITGMADGIDMLAGEAVAKLRDVYPNVRLVAVLPFKNQSGHNDEHYSTFRFTNLLYFANEVHYLSDEYYRGCYFARNRFMVNHSSLLIAAVAKDTGGTAHTVEYARSKGVETRIIDLNAMKRDLNLKAKEIPNQSSFF